MVINSGSGNQGITVSVPVIVYAQRMELPREKLLRALVAANLISIHQKRYIGSLSAYCGVVSAACGRGLRLCCLLDYPYTVLRDTITNTIATVGGMVCDGAKSSCAAKIATGAGNRAARRQDEPAQSASFSPARAWWIRMWRIPFITSGGWGAKE